MFNENLANMSLNEMNAFNLFILDLIVIERKKYALGLFRNSFNRFNKILFNHILRQIDC